MATDPDNDILIRAVMESSTGLVEDQVVNDFAFHSEFDIDPGGLAVYANLVSEFYRAPQANTHTVGEYISDAVNRAATHEIQVYRIQADGSLGSPSYVTPWLGPVTFTGSAGLPTEVAGVLSFHADLTGVLEEVGATRPKARRRGRIYIPCLGNNAIQGTTPPYRLATLFTDTLRQAAVTLMTESAGRWAVWSRADHVLRPVVGGWTDNAPDTQRRRGPKANVRVTFS